MNGEAIERQLVLAEERIAVAGKSLAAAGGEAGQAALEVSGQRLELAKWLLAEAGRYRISDPDACLRMARQAAEAAVDAYCLSLPSRAAEARGAWYRPKERDVGEVRATLDRMQAAGMNELYVETWYWGYTIFPSRIAAAFGVEAQHPAFRGWDPLDAFATEAAKRGIAVHAWLDGLMVGVDKSGGPVLRAHPDWCALPRSGAEAAEPVPQRTTGYYWLDVTNPQVQSYLRGIIGEMVTGYGIAGINLDFMRLPHAEKSGDEYCFSRYARNSFALEFGADPLAIDRAAQPELWRAWTGWLARSEDEFVASVYRDVKLARPDAVVSAAPEPGAEADHIGRWAEHVDIVIPQAYRQTAREVRQSVLAHMALLPPDMPVYAGIYPMYIGLGAFEAVEQAVAASETTGGTVLFSLGHVQDDTLRALRLGPWRTPAVPPGVRPLEAAAATVAAALPGLSSAGGAAEAVGAGMRLAARLREGGDTAEPDDWAAETVAALEVLAAQLDVAHAAGAVSSASLRQAAVSLAEAKRFVYHWRIRQSKLPQRRSRQP